MRVLVVVIIAVSVTATLFCPPGFVPQGSSCVCAHWKNGMVVCDEDSLTASMQVGYCMTYDNKFYYPLPTSASDLNVQVCGPSNRKGLLCGECQDGFAVSPVLIISCINCTDDSHGWIKYSAAAYLPITILFVIIITFSINVVSGPINSFLFFGQVTTAHFLNIGFWERESVLLLVTVLVFNISINNIFHLPSCPFSYH